MKKCAVAAAAALAGTGACLAATSAASTTSGAPAPALHLTAHRLRPRRGAVVPGTAVASSRVYTTRVFADASVGFALANDGSAQYPVRSVDGGRTWRIDGPQVHVDAADGPEGVGYVGVLGPRTFFTYGSSVVDVTPDGGRDWWQTYLGELVTGVVTNPRGHLVAYVQQSVSNNQMNPALTWQYVSSDGGRHWSFSTALGG